MTENLPSDWDQWVLTNLLRGVPKENVIQTLTKRGFSDTQIDSAFYERSITVQNEQNNSIKKLPNKLKEWVGTNLLQGVDRSEIANILTSLGYSSEEISLELETAAKSPYLKSGVKPSKLLKKRKWLLNTYDDLARLDIGYNQKIDVIDTPPFDVLSYAEETVQVNLVN